MADYYLNDFHRKHCEALCKEVEQMKQQPLSYADKLEQYHQNEDSLFVRRLNGTAGKDHSKNE